MLSKLVIISCMLGFGGGGFVRQAQLCGWRVQAALLFFVALLASCGGGSGGQTPPAGASSPTTVTVSPSVDSSLQSNGALAIAKTMTSVETQPLGTSIASRADADTVVFALDGAEKVALAAYIVNGRAIFSAEGTVLALGSTVLATVSPSMTIAELQSSVRSADGFPTLVGELSAAVLAGKNPLNEANVQQGFDRVLTAASRATVQAQSGRAHPQAVAPIHADATFEPSVLETATFRVSIANKSAGVLKFDSKVYLRNTSALFFTTALLDVSGAQRTSDPLEGAGASLFSLNGALPLEIPKPFAGSFSVRLSIDDDRNKAEYVKSALKLVKVFNSDCAGKFSELAAKKAVDVSFGVTPNDWLKQVLKDAGWTAVSDCAKSFVAPESVLALVDAYSKISKVVGFARLASDRLLLPASIPDTGVCLSENQVQMSCVAAITATAINPMMPGAVQPIDIQFIDEKGKKTLAPPYGLDIKYSNSGLFTISSTFTQIIAGGFEGTGDVSITDPATDKRLAFGVTVTNGKLDQTAYSVPVMGLVGVKLVDPASGAEVFRNPATFDIHLANTTFGNFIVGDSPIGGIAFQATATATPAPQAIFLGTRDSGSTLIVNSVDTGYWFGTFTPVDCQAPPAGMGWFWEVPCFNIGVIDGQDGSTFWFPSAGGNVTMESVGTVSVRKVYDVIWNATDLQVLRLAMPTEVLLPSNSQGRFFRYSGTRLIELSVDRRSANEISGTFVVTSASGASVPAVLDFAGNFFTPIETRATGTWNARLVAGRMPITNMNGFDLCLRGGGGFNYRNLDAMVFTPGNGNYYTSLGWGSQSGTCVYGP